MRLSFSAALLSVCLLSAQTPNLSGVWKTNPEPSKMNGRGPSNSLMIIDQQGSTLSEKIGVSGRHGEERSTFKYNTDGKQSMNSFHGLPMRTKASWEGSTLVLDSQVAGPRPLSIHEKYSLSADGTTLTVDSVTTRNGRDMERKMLFEKQPDSAGDPLRKPEETAGAHFKNVHVLQNLPVSQFIDTMRFFSVSLGVDCEHCHVQHEFASDDKPAKLMARRMILMTRSIDEQTFHGRMRVRCYTCHRGHLEPPSAPTFEGGPSD